MSTFLRSSRLIDSATPSIGYDNQVQSACTAFDNQMWEIIDDTGQVCFIPNIMGLTDSNLVDILAWQFHVDFYDATQPLDFRKALVQLSIIWHRTKGTVALVNSVLQTYLPGVAYLQEWWQYHIPFPPPYPVENVDRLITTFRPSDVNLGADKFTIAAPLADGAPIYFKKSTTGNVLPAPIVELTTYYIVNWTPTQFQIAATVGGTAINLTSSGTGTGDDQIWDKGSLAGSWHDRYRFRVLINEDVDPDTETLVVNLVNAFKPISRWMEGVVRPESSGFTAYIAAAVRQYINRTSEAAPLRGSVLPVKGQTTHGTQ